MGLFRQESAWRRTAEGVRVETKDRPANVGTSVVTNENEAGRDVPALFADKL